MKWLLKVLKTAYNFVSKYLPDGRTPSIKKLKSKTKKAEKIQNESVQANKEKAVLIKKEKRQQRKLQNKAKRIQLSTQECIDELSLPHSSSRDTLGTVETFEEPTPTLHVMRRLPKCFKDEYLKLLVRDISSNVKQLKIGPRKVFLIGSANFKLDSVHDLDILFHIECPEDRVKARKLIRLFRKQGAKITAIDKITGELGVPKLKQENRRVIPMIWNRFKLDFILFSDSLFTHASGLDYTVSAFYYDLFEEQMYGFPGLSHEHDMNKNIVDTIADPIDSFTKDPIRILRGIRIITSEPPYAFSHRCIQAIRVLSCPQNQNGNIFKDVEIGRLYHYLALLCEPHCLTYSIDYLHRLSLLIPLFEIVQQDKSSKSAQYIALLLPYMQYYYPPQLPMHLVPMPLQVINHFRFFKQSTQDAYFTDELKPNALHPDQG